MFHWDSNFAFVKYNNNIYNNIYYQFSNVQVKKIKFKLNYKNFRASGQIRANALTANQIFLTHFSKVVLIRER